MKPTLTNVEEKWVKELEALLKRRPKKLVLFANGELYVLKSTPEYPNARRTNGFGMAREAIVYIIGSCVEGGDF